LKNHVAQIACPKEPHRASPAPSKPSTIVAKLAETAVSMFPVSFSAALFSTAETSEVFM
jgi:hypothetical protein